MPSEGEVDEAATERLVQDDLDRQMRRTLWEVRNEMVGNEGDRQAVAREIEVDRSGQ